VVERLPAYTPELNPVEGLWSSLKTIELANLATSTLSEVIEQAHRGVERVRRTPHLAYSFRATPAFRSRDGSDERASRSERYRLGLRVGSLPGQSVPKRRAEASIWARRRRASSSGSTRMVPSTV